MAGFSFFRRSLAFDDVDRYTNTWAVFLFLLLSLLSLLMPLSPTLSESMRQESAPISVKTPTPISQRQKTPRVKATCWTPEKFLAPYVTYANEYCSDVANGMLKGIKSDRTLYELSDTAVAVDELNLTSISVSRKGYFDGVEQQKDQEERNEQVRKSAQELVDFRTPVILFLLALGLLLPYMLWTLANNMMPAILNVDMTLQASVESRTLDNASQKQIQDETTQAVLATVQKSKNTACILYLLLKIFVILAVFGETFFVSNYVVPDIHSMAVDFVGNPLKLASSSSSSSSQTDSKDKSDGGNTMDDSLGLFDFPNNILRCGFKIKHFKSTDKHIVQCLFTRVYDQEHCTQQPPETIVTQPTTSTSIESTLLLYQALFTVVLAFLTILVIANVINTVSWFLRIFVGSYAKAMGLPGNAPKDVLLLVHMAWLNVGPRVARALAQSTGKGGSKEGPEGAPMLETKA